jgi:DMSO/TMAO reductase YedYZ molybdopterin-dependent catalytic subunit
MNRNVKIVLVIFVALIIAAIPLYYYTRPTTPESAALQIKGEVSNPSNMTLAEVKAYTPTTVQVTLSSSSRPSDNGDFNYTGVQLSELLNQAQTSPNATEVYVQASDGYGTTLPIQDALKQDTIIAYEKDGEPLTELKDDGEGPLRLIIGNDQYAQRWVRGVVAIEVR